MTEPALTQPAIPQPAPAEAGLMRRLAGYLGPALSLAILGAVGYQLFWELKWELVLATIPRSPLIWAVLIASYMAGPVADWVIFRKLWGIPATGMFPLLKKLIGNELLLGYVGEVYFYDWARRHVKMAGSPFGAVKDVAILSALAGNIVTVALLVVTWPVIKDLQFGEELALPFGLSLRLGMNVLGISVIFLLVTSGVIMFFRNGLLSLPLADLWFVFAVHTVRLLANTGLSALVWHLILPEVPIQSWLLYSTVRLLISRLPLIPNKDIAFAGVTALLAGKEVQTGVMIAMISMLIVATHVVLFIALMLLDLVQKEKSS